MNGLMCISLVAALLAASPSEEPRVVTVGNEEALECRVDGSTALLPRQVVLERVEVMHNAASDPESPTGLLVFWLRWGSEHFLAEVDALGRDKTVVRSAPARLMIQLPAQGQIGREERTIETDLGIGESQSVTLFVGAGALKLCTALIEQEQFTPPTALSVTWRGRRYPLTVTPPRSFRIRPAAPLAPLRLVGPVGVDSPTRLVVELSGEAVSRTAWVGSNSVLVEGLPRDPVHYRILHTVVEGFTNEVEGDFDLWTEGVSELRLPVVIRRVLLPEGDIQDWRPGEKYLICWLVDGAGELRIGYALRDRAMGDVEFELMAREGYPLKDGLLLSFDRKGKLTAARNVDSHGFDLPHPFLSITPRQPQCSEVTRNWLRQCLRQRIRGLVTPARADAAPELVEAMVKVIEESQALLGASPLTLNGIREVHRSVASLDLQELRCATGSLVHTMWIRTATPDTALQALRDGRPWMERDGSDGARVRAAAVGFLSRSSTVAQTEAARLAQDLLAGAREWLSLEQRRVLWDSLEQILVPYHSSLTDSLDLLQEGRSVAVQTQSGSLVALESEGDGALRLHLGASSLADALGPLCVTANVQSLLCHGMHKELTPADITQISRCFPQLQECELETPMAVCRPGSIGIFGRNLPQLAELRLSYKKCERSALEGLELSQTLRRLHLKGCTHALSVLGKLGGLRELVLLLDGCHHDPGSALCALRLLGRLEVLQLGLMNTTVNANELSWLTNLGNLRRLTLFVPEGVDVSGLRDAKGLRTLRIACPRHSEVEGLEALPSVEELTLWTRKPTARLLEAVGSMPEVQDVHLSFQVAGTLAAESFRPLWKPPRLAALRLSLPRGGKLRAGLEAEGRLRPDVSTTLDF